MVARGEHTTLAAVALILRDLEPALALRALEPAPTLELGALEVLLIKRAEHPRDPWSGHMAFPGGRLAAADACLLSAAIRETREEVGLALEFTEHLGRLDDLQAVARARPVDLVIEPHVFLLTRASPLTLDKTEVESAVWAPVAPMLSGASGTTRSYVHEGQALELPGFRVGDDVVWGMTHRMLASLLAVLRA
ncbi:MAG: CoA pyrophosphatase [Myxococcales bacterium]|nr:CoA pyrophosphatase [Myxococcales bacterium]